MIAHSRCQFFRLLPFLQRISPFGLQTPAWQGLFLRVAGMTSTKLPISNFIVPWAEEHLPGDAGGVHYAYGFAGSDKAGPQQVFFPQESYCGVV